MLPLSCLFTKRFRKTKELNGKCTLLCEATHSTKESANFLGFDFLLAVWLLGGKKPCLRYPAVPLFVIYVLCVSFLHRGRVYFIIKKSTREEGTSNGEKE